LGFAIPAEFRCIDADEPNAASILQLDRVSVIYVDHARPFIDMRIAARAAGNGHLYPEQCGSAQQQRGK
jgi:hypothetical protein